MFHAMFYAGMIFTVIFLIITIVFFVKNNIKKCIGDLTGWNAKRDVKRKNKKQTAEIFKIPEITEKTDDYAEEEKTGRLNVQENIAMEKSGERETTTLLSDEEKYATNIFKVQERVIVVHTDEWIDSTWNEEK